MFVQPFASDRKPAEKKNLPSYLTDFYNEKNKNHSLEQLREMAIDISITDEESMAVFFETLQQSKKNNWFKFRAGRITASNFKTASRTSVEKPSLSLIKSICYPLKALFKAKATSWGIKYEDEAFQEYQDSIKSEHRNFSVTKCGFIISLENPIFGASPDGLIVCDCCDDRCVEIKCPYRMSDSSINFDDFCNLNSFLKKDESGSFFLDPSHEYYYQVQLQMYCTETKFCDFIIWSKYYGVLVLHIPADNQFISFNLQKAINFHKNVIKPELLARWYTTIMTTRTSDSALELWCYCNKKDDGTEMIQCANDMCNIKLFHRQCVNLAPPRSENDLWLCDMCKLNSPDALELDVYTM